VPDRNDNVYAFRSLADYTFKDRLIIRAAGLVSYILIRLIGRTLRFEVEGVDALDDKNRTYDQPIMCTWHNRIFAGMYYMRYRGIVVMSSISFDAEYTARCIQRLGFGIVKGSSTRGGTRALVEMIRVMKRGVPITFTADGPRGPIYVAKPGPPMLAKKTGNPMIPVSVALEKYWTIKSWDRFQIPKPFARVNMIFGDPIFVAADAGDGELEAKRQEMENAINALVKRGDEWVRSLRKS
jgi:lysophospholipid acyltransferase (LPLAT)-like uncharacterized protein